MRDRFSGGRQRGLGVRLREVGGGVGVGPAGPRSCWATGVEVVAGPVSGSREQAATEREMEQVGLAGWGLGWATLGLGPRGWVGVCFFSFSSLFYFYSIRNSKL